jgi:hypothetical protein
VEQAQACRPPAPGCRSNSCRWRESREQLPAPEWAETARRLGETGTADTPELQPAEHLCPLADEPVVNRHFETLDALDAVLADVGVGAR